MHFSVCLVKKMITFILLNGMILYFIKDITIVTIDLPLLLFYTLFILQKMQNEWDKSMEMSYVIWFFNKISFSLN